MADSSYSMMGVLIPTHPGLLLLGIRREKSKRCIWEPAENGVFQVAFPQFPAVLDILSYVSWCFKKYFLGLPWWSSGRLCTSTAGDLGSITGWGTKILRATQHGRKKRGKQRNTFWLGYKAFLVYSVTWLLFLNNIIRPNVAQWTAWLSGNGVGVGGAVTESHRGACGLCNVAASPQKPLWQVATRTGDGQSNGGHFELDLMGRGWPISMKPF